MRQQLCAAANVIAQPCGPGRVAGPIAAKTRPKASDASLAPGLWLGTRALELTPQVLADYLRDMRETAPLYAEQGIAHQGLVLRMCNWLLAQNLALDPWIRIGSSLRFYGEARLGEALTACGRINANIDRKARYQKLQPQVIQELEGEHNASAKPLRQQDLPGRIPPIRAKPDRSR